MVVQVEGAEGTKDSSKNRGRVAAKLGKPGLEVTVTDCSTSGLLVARFAYAGKTVTFSKRKDVEVSEKKTDKLKNVELPAEIVSETRETALVDEISPASGDKMVENKCKKLEQEAAAETEREAKQNKPTETTKVQVEKFSSLPSLVLLEEVQITGTVTYVSPQGGVWFSPLWAQEKLFQLTEKMDSLKDELMPRVTEVQEGELCLARSEDGCLYRARVIGINRPENSAKKSTICVQFFDFGNLEEVDVVLEYPASLGLDLAPAAAEVVLARSVSRSQDMQDVLEKCLMGEEERYLELQLEKDKETGMKVATFYENGKEIQFDKTIEVSSVFDKRDRSVEESDDVVVESEDFIKNVPEVKTAEDRVAQSAKPVGMEETFALVKTPPMNSDVVTVVVVLVESVSKVWVTRKEEESKVNKLMSALEKMVPRLVPASKVTVGCVYGSKFSEDGEMYRVVVEQLEAREVVVRFIDYGNSETKQVEELLQLPGKMARYPAAAVMVELEENKEVEDSQDNRDKVEMKLDGDVEMIFTQDRLTEVKVAGKTINFGFKTKVKQIVKGIEEKMDAMKVGKTTENKNVTKVMDSKADIPKETEVNRKELSPTSSDGGELTNLHDVLDRNTKPRNSSEVRKPKLLTRNTPARPRTGSSSVGESSVSRPRHGDRSTYVPPALRKPSSTTRAAVVAQVQEQPDSSKEIVDQDTKNKNPLPAALEVLKSMLEKELPVSQTLLDRQKGDGEEKVDTVTLQPRSTSKVDDWLARNEASLRLEKLEDPVMESTPVSSSSPRFVSAGKTEEREVPGSKEEYREERTGQETQHSLDVVTAQDDLTKLLARAPHSPSSLITTRESSEILQSLIGVLPPSSLQPVLSIVLDNFKELATNRFVKLYIGEL